MTHKERCENPECGKIHSPAKFTAVYINKHYYCKPSCANRHGELSKGGDKHLIKHDNGA